MQYFDTLPKIIKTDNVGNSVIMTDLMARCSIIPEILKNPMVYYDYDVRNLAGVQVAQRISPLIGCNHDHRVSLFVLPAL
jgi:hypothetical protein